MSKKLTIFISIFAITAITMAFNNCAPVHESEGSGTLPSTNPDSVTFFSTSVYPILTANCANCHGDNNIFNVVEFASTSAEVAHDGFFNRNLFDENNPANSAIVLKISPGTHNNMPASLAGDIETAITSWLDQVANSGN